MRLPSRLLLTCALLGAHAVPVGAAEPQPKRHIVYLHGRIVQEHGPDAVSAEHGPYQFHRIVAAMARDGAEVHAPLREQPWTLQQGAAQATAIVRGLLSSGTPADHITVVGASQGAIITMLVSTALDEPRLRYVVMAGCNDFVFDELKPRLHGHVLSIHDASDTMVGSCAPLFAASAEAASTHEIRIDTGLGHGFLYRPMPIWLRAVRAWAANVKAPAAARGT